ncbi:AAA family ATPase [Paenibacillus sp. B01]|uniref:AAA family ATPase n=1 Tax=Paenibacillus sp. B01 TaxID=2660554 RepID=UPI00129B644C|nr:MoxR family ATPase [Paenibacillus sp. B01]QGG58335.1 AAA domain-containing protein [Paenibacillus sp. B01]
MEQVKALADAVRTSLAQTIVGKGEEVELLLTALLASGHVLLEDVPGTGKTLLAQSLAAALGLEFRRVQFTPDLLPSDLTGIHYYNQKEGEFRFRPGPLFTQIVLADEINRATPRTQSSLLECMEERQISIEGETMALREPFLVLATQNPIDSQGTFPLPEAQMDRFMIRMKLGYPDREEGVEILRRTALGQLQRGGTPGEKDPAAAGGRADEGNRSREAQLLEAQRRCREVAVHADLLAYFVELAEATREHPDALLGVSPRGTQAWLRAAQAYAAMQGRAYVLPDDIKRLAVPVCAHRIVPRRRQEPQAAAAGRIVQDALARVPVPSEEALAALAASAAGGAGLAGPAGGTGGNSRAVGAAGSAGGVGPAGTSGAGRFAGTAGEPGASSGAGAGGR